MVNDGKGRLFRRKDGKYLVYLPMDVCEDSMFPFKVETSMVLKLGFKLKGESLWAEQFTEEDAERERVKWQVGEVAYARGRLFRRIDGKYLIYVPLHYAEDSMFPFQNFREGRRGGAESVDVKVSFEIGGKKELLIEEWIEPEEE